MVEYEPETDDWGWGEETLAEKLFLLIVIAGACGCLFVGLSVMVISTFWGC